MNELIPIKTGSKTGRSCIDARELHEFLESKQDFSNWIVNRVLKYGFEEDEDFSINLLKSNGGRPSKQYIVSIDMAKELSMVENNHKGRIARKYFIEWEKIGRSKQIALPSRKELAQMVIEAENKIESLSENNKLQEQIIINKDLKLRQQEPKVRFAEAVEKSDGSILVRHLAKHISSKLNVKIGQNKFYEWMRKEEIVNKKNEPYQRYYNYGWFTFGETNITSTNHSWQNHTTRVTGKGQVALCNLYLRKNGLSKSIFDK